jgi:hypothetical protein
MAAGIAPAQDSPTGSMVDLNRRVGEAKYSRGANKTVTNRVSNSRKREGNKHRGGVPPTRTVACRVCMFLFGRSTTLMTQQSQPSARIVLHEDAGLGQIRVDLDAFLEFQSRLEREIEALVVRWVHAAAPCASRGPHARRAIARP